MRIITELNSDSAFMESSDIICNSNIWHKFMVRNIGNWDQEKILDAIDNYIRPLNLHPVHCRFENGYFSFVANNTEEFIKLLCANRMKMKTPYKNKPLTFEIALDFLKTERLKYDPQDYITKFLKRNFNGVVLNLNSFQKDKDVSVVKTLSKSLLCNYIMQLASLQFKPRILKCADNELTSVESIVFHFQDVIIDALDLSNNKINNFKEIQSLALLNLTELWLDGNPICGQYNSLDYLIQIKGLFEQLQYLDGKEIFHFNKDVPPKKNFLCNYFGKNLVEEFIQKFFSLYDNDRVMLLDLYHPSALFSMSTTFHQHQKSSNKSEFLEYEGISRNLLQITDSSYNDEYLFDSNVHILKVYSHLPHTEHNSNSFTTDLLFYNPSCAMISVSGTFREKQNKHITYGLYSFSRIFLLTKQGDHYSIINDILHIENLMDIDSRILEDFSVFLAHPLQNISERHEHLVIEVFSDITGLTHKWSERFLKGWEFDISKAIPFFQENFEKVPLKAFKLYRTGIDWKTQPLLTNSTHIQNTACNFQPQEYFIPQPQILMQQNVVQQNYFINQVPKSQSESDLEVVKIKRPKNVPLNATCIKTVNGEKMMIPAGQKYISIWQKKTNVIIPTNTEDVTEKNIVDLTKDDDTDTKKEEESYNQQHKGKNNKNKSSIKRQVYVKNLNKIVMGFNVMSLLPNPDLNRLNKKLDFTSKKGSHTGACKIEVSDLSIEDENISVFKVFRLSRIPQGSFNLNEPCDVKFVTKNGFFKWYTIPANENYIDVEVKVTKEQEKFVKLKKQKCNIGNKKPFHCKYITLDGFVINIVLNPRELVVEVPQTPFSQSAENWKPPFPKPCPVKGKNKGKKRNLTGKNIENRKKVRITGTNEEVSIKPLENEKSISTKN